MAEIASAAIRGGIGALLGGGPAGSIGVLLGALIGAPGKAIGGPVTPGRPYLVGERGPELFVPTAAGRIDAAGRGGARDVRLSITVNAGQAGAPEALKASSRQVARAVRRALIDAGD
jgi:hypothetical protein